MSKIFIFFLLIISHYAISKEVDIAYGVNRIDLNGNGLKDYVVKATFDKNMSYSQTGLTFFVNGKNGEVNIIATPENDKFTWFDRRIASASLALVDNRLYENHGDFYLINAQKEISNDSPLAESRINLRIYRFSVTEPKPGIPAFEWYLVKTLQSKDLYISAEQGFDGIDMGILTKND